jgi:hypothetical protein
VKLKLQFIIAAVFVLMIYIPAVHAQANLTFSGGNGTPLSTTLQTAVTYTTTSDCGDNPNFVFQEVGDPLAGVPRGVTGNITVSINGGAAKPIDRQVSGVASNGITANDLYVFGNLEAGTINGMVVLSAGTITTTSNVTGAPPTNRSYITFLVNNHGGRCTSNGVAVPATAASVSISGKVITNNRRGLSNAIVYLTDSQGNTLTARTNSLGYYRFNDISAGQSVTVTVVSKRYQFAPQVVNVNEEMSGLNFLAEQ